MSNNNTWIAFRASQKLHQTTDGFIERMRGGSTRPEPDTIETIMATFIHEVLNNFFLMPTEQAGLPASTRKVVQFTADTIEKATHMVIRSTARKLDIVQNQRAAEYMDSVRFSLNIKDEQVWFVGFPLDETVAARGRQAIELGLAGHTSDGKQAMMTYLHQVTDLGLYWFFEEPIKLLHFGPILRKVAEVGVVTTRKATHTVIDKVFPGMNDEQLKIISRFVRMQQVQGPTHDRA